MTPDILVDSDAFVAINRVADVHHEKAVAINKSLLKVSANLITTNYVLQETTTVLSRKMAQQKAREFLSLFRKDTPMLVIHIDKRLDDEASRIFLKEKRDGTSFVDCSNVAVAKTFNIDTIFSFDKFYLDYGLELLE